MKTTKRDEQILLESESGNVIKFDWEADCSMWLGNICFRTDGDDLSDLSDLKNTIDILTMVKELKEFIPTISIQLDGDRGGEYFQIDLNYDEMECLINKW